MSSFSLLLLGDIYFLWDGCKTALTAGEGIFQALASDALQGFGLILVLPVVVLFLFPVVLPWRAVRRFRRFPGSSGNIHAVVTPEEIEVRLEATGLSRFQWKAYKFWREGKRVVILVLRQGQYQLLPKTGLSEGQRAELRGILKAALLKK